MKIIIFLGFIEDTSASILLKTKNPPDPLWTLSITLWDHVAVPIWIVLTFHEEKRFLQGVDGGLAPCFLCGCVFGSGGGGGNFLDTR